MDNILKDKWIFALQNEDNKYKKTDAGLHVDDCHCGLGILCDVLNLEEFEDTTDYKGYKFGRVKSKADYHFQDDYGDMVTGFTQEFLDFVELQRNHYTKIMELNEKDPGNSYASVIAYIEENL